MKLWKLLSSSIVEASPILHHESFSRPVTSISSAPSTKIQEKNPNAPLVIAVRFPKKIQTISFVLSLLQSRHINPILRLQTTRLQLGNLPDPTIRRPRRIALIYRHGTLARIRPVIVRRADFDAVGEGVDESGGEFGFVGDGVGERAVFCEGEACGGVRGVGGGGECGGVGDVGERGGVEGIVGVRTVGEGLVGRDWGVVG